MGSILLCKDDRLLDSREVGVCEDERVGLRHGFGLDWIKWLRAVLIYSFDFACLFCDYRIINGCT